MAALLFARLSGNVSILFKRGKLKEAKSTGLGFGSDLG